jgi:hypothetical protein
MKIILGGLRFQISEEKDDECKRRNVLRFRVLNLSRCWFKLVSWFLNFLLNYGIILVFPCWCLGILFAV